MKTTQKTLITCLLLSIALFSCNDKTLEEVASNSADSNARRGVTGFSIKVSALPAMVLTYITTNYPDKTIIKAEVYPAFYELTLSDLTKLKFDLKGQIIADKSSSTTSSEIPVASLPAAIADYMKANYPNNPIVKAEKGASGYEVTIDTGLKLEFNLDGTFREISGNNNAGGVENGEHITTQALPANTLTYLATNYPNNPVVKAEKDASGYEVTLNTGLKLEFNADGTFREISGSNNNNNNGGGNSDHVTTQTLPAATLAYLLANYPNNPVVKAEKDGSGYEVTLNTGLKLEFNADGTFREISGSNNNNNNGGGNSDHINTQTLPAATLAYLLANYPNNPVVKAEKDGSGYEVTLNTGLKLEFNADGTFKEISNNGGSSNSGSSNSGSGNSGSSNSGSSNSGSGNSGSSNSGSANSGSGNSGSSNSGSSNSGSGNSGSSNSGSSNSGNGNSGSSNSGSSNSGSGNSGSSNSGSSNSGNGNSGSSNSGSSNSGSGKDGGKDSGKSEKEKKGKG